ncbi:hypothetical protein RJ641_000123 [Dillenia turbinata]|uniref:tRNA dimethylallyltransferase n=1 Tax=Dillenia turbinata TaxID=194707 RepID=A0AAN8ZVF5_9MAGN
MLSGVGGGLRTCRLSLPSHVTTTTRLLFRRQRIFSTLRKNEKQKVIVISGPTGAGKSRLAIELAKSLNGEIISADSVQVYKGLDVGSAKPSLRDRKEVPHHLIDILHPSEEYSVGQFFEDARQATQYILNCGRVPIVTGGTGLFIYGKPDVPKASHEITSDVYSELRDLQNDGNWDAAVQLVVNAGDTKAQYLAANDWYRLRRSLEIIKSSGLPPSAFQVPYDSFRKQLESNTDETSPEASFSDESFENKRSQDLDYEFICFFLSSQRLDLYRLIDSRCEDMLSGAGSDGLLAEVRWLLDVGLLPHSNSATRAIGYRQAMEYLLRCRQQGGRSSPSEFYNFLFEFQKASRNFAKRQMTWFRNETIYHWLDASKPLEKVLDFICNAYHDDSGVLTVLESLKMRNNISSTRESNLLKSYRTQNRQFVSREDCAGVLDWIWRTQGCRDTAKYVQ